MAAYVYILASKRKGTLYVGVTSDIVRRVHQHRNGQGSRFTKRYNVKQLVYYEVFEDIQHAIAREKAVKEWKRLWKIEKIEETNPEWRDLYPEISAP